MAALRRLIPLLTNSFKTGTFTTQKATKVLKVVSVGTAATGAAYYYYYCCSYRRSGLKSHVEARLFHPGAAISLCHR
ncbi:hypothetical protein KUCAC02_003925 [Chaenocephalus aceratus]|uniref:Uncharacterized protein n=1 Tax=Chaenocephalus aceratus TaxID=36190 RepID=A0ACB9WY67_CHAAC|nr:hypothetical protein KUCAC02_003925 [Chaenocephalus aceratus]